MEINTSLLWMQAGLLGAVTPFLRAVTVDLDVEKERQIFCFYYDCEVTDKLFDLASVALTEASCSCDYFSEEHILKLEFPKKIPVRGRLAYLRKERGSEFYTQKRYNFNITSSIAKLLLYIQQAMLGRVAENLRSVRAEIEDALKIIRIYFTCDGTISEENKDLADLIVGEACKPFAGYKIERSLERIDCPQRIPHAEPQRFAYLRYEGY